MDCLVHFHIQEEFKNQIVYIRYYLDKQKKVTIHLENFPDQQLEPAVPLAVMLNAASKWVHSFLHKSYFSSNPLEQNYSTCIYAFFASELLSLILAANITQFEG